VARDPDIIHLMRTIRRADATAYAVEILWAHFIPEKRFFFASFLVYSFASFLCQVSSFAAHSFRFGAIQAIVPPAVRTIELAITKDASVAFFTDRVAQ